MARTTALWVLPLLGMLQVAAAENAFGCAGRCSEDGRCEVDWSDDCDDRHYGSEPGLVVIVILAGLCLLGVCGWICVWCCCSCCGDGKGSATAKRLKWVFVCLVLVGGVISLGLGFTGVNEVVDARDGLFDAALNETDILFVPHIENEKQVLRTETGEYLRSPNGRSMEFVVTETEQAYRDVRDEVEKVQKDVEDVPDWVLYMTFAPVWLLVLIGLCVALTNGACSGVCATLFFFFACLSWLLALILVSVVYISEDACFEVEQMNTEGAAPGMLRDLIDDACPSLNDTRDNVEREADAAAGGVCQLLSARCVVEEAGAAWSATEPARVFACPRATVELCAPGEPVGWPFSWRAGSARPLLPPASEILAYEMLPGTPGGCSGGSACDVQECSDGACSGETKAAAGDLATSLDFGVRMQRVLEEDVLVLMDCGTVRKSVSNAAGECDEFVDAYTTYTGAGCLAAIMVTFLAIALAAGTWSDTSDSKKEEGEEEKNVEVKVASNEPIEE